MTAPTDLSERRDRLRLRPWTILGVGLGTAALLAATLGGVMLLRHSAEWPQAGQPPSRFPAPRLQADPAADLHAFQAEQARALQGYDWVDREGGLARVPVAHAMEILAGRGPAAYDPLEPAP
ncbi:hypothetical protein ACFQU7_12955 [Pseudoroseomonas wenyumeiae]